MRDGITEGKTKKSNDAIPREMELDLTYTDPEGQSYRTVVVSRIKTGEQRIQVGQIAAGLVSGSNWPSLPTAIQARVWTLANLTVQVAEAPDWLLRWAQEDDQLLFGVAQELEAHELRYFRGHPEQGEGDEVVSRVAISPVDAPAGGSFASPTDTSGAFSSGQIRSGAPSP